MSIELTQSSELDQLRLAAVEFEGVQVIPSSESLREWTQQVVQGAIQQAESPESELLRQQVRQMLRHGSFKASGRSKPAQEYLLRCAVQDGTLPIINAPVDILNTVSLSFGLPISLLSIAKCSSQLLVRRGLAGESYAFNAGGQELNVTDLVVVCDQSNGANRPVGSPIKDSMAGKIETQDTHLVAVIYAPVGAENLMQSCSAALLEHFMRFLPDVCGQPLDVERL